MLPHYTDPMHCNVWEGHKSLQMLCVGSETPTQWKSESLTDGLTNGYSVSQSVNQGHNGFKRC